MNAVILVTGNDNLNRIMQRARFAGLGCAVTEAMTLSEAQTYLRCGLTPEVIVINTREVSAQVRDFIAFVRSSLALAARIVVVVTSKAAELDAAPPGADLYLTRPLAFDDLHFALQMLRAAS